MPAPLGAEAQFKLALMRVIDDDLRRRFRTVTEAAEFANVPWFRLSRIRSGRHELFSVNWLFTLATKAKIPIRINVESMNR